MKEEKLKRFIGDDVMANAVYDVIHSSFLGRKGTKDVQILAAERLALDFLDEAWRELDRYKAKEDTQTPQLRQVGL